MSVALMRIKLRLFITHNLLDFSKSKIKIARIPALNYYMSTL